MLAPGRNIMWILLRSVLLPIDPVMFWDCQCYGAFADRLVVIHLLYPWWALERLLAHQHRSCKGLLDAAANTMTHKIPDQPR